MAITKRCPICHSPTHWDNQSLNLPALEGIKEDLRSQGIYVWTDDPILTRRGLAGDNEKGFTYIRCNRIKELQIARSQQEEGFGIPIDERTEFTEVSPITQQITLQHITELRYSTEKILKILGHIQSGGEADLSYYFNYDEEGNYMGTQKYGEILPDKTEWTDVDRTTGLPSIPTHTTEGKRKKINILAIHIEELRHPALAGYWIESFNKTIGFPTFTCVENQEHQSLYTFDYIWELNINTQVPYIESGDTASSKFEIINKSESGDEEINKAYYTLLNVSSHQVGGFVKAYSSLERIDDEAGGGPVPDYGGKIIICRPNLRIKTLGSLSQSISLSSSSYANSRIWIQLDGDFPEGGSVTHLIYHTSIGNWEEGNFAVSDLSNMNRNLKDDYETLLGFSISDSDWNKKWISFILIRNSLHVGDVGNGSLEFELDYIKLY